MSKELIICIVVVIMIFGLNYITQTNTDRAVEQMKQYLEDTRQELLDKSPNYDMARKKAEATFNKWEELDDTMAFYIEHDEIEKVTTAITSTKSFVEKEDDSQAVDSIDRCKYILEHIDEREKFTLDNIF